MKNAFDVKSAMPRYPVQCTQTLVKGSIVLIVIMNEWHEVENIMKNGKDGRRNGLSEKPDRSGKSSHPLH
jgi:hypothetical protein